jgi:hypothetical protein
MKKILPRAALRAPRNALAVTLFPGYFAAALKKARETGCHANGQPRKKLYQKDA